MQAIKPTLLLDEDRCRANIRRMAGKAQRNRVVFRPHFKTHQSLEVGRWFKECGVERIAVSSVDMAEFFSSEWYDITLAFPLNIPELDRIHRLARRIRLHLLIASPEAAAMLVRQWQVPAGFFIKIDTGARRSGICPDDTARIDTLLTITNRCPQLQFMGFLSHDGHTYACRSTAGVRSIHTNSIRQLQKLKTAYQAKHPDIILSVGDTPSCSLPDDLGGADEIRPGNFVFYDLMQLQTGSAQSSQLALAMHCPIVDIHPGRQELVVYGGAIHFSKEQLVDPVEGVVFGRVVQSLPGGHWGEVVPGAVLSRLYQEHGIVRLPGNSHQQQGTSAEKEAMALLNKARIGDSLHILPVHACLAVSCMKSMTLLPSGRCIHTTP